jgi:hypothetical protein
MVTKFEGLHGFVDEWWKHIEWCQGYLHLQSFVAKSFHAIANMLIVCSIHQHTEQEEDIAEMSDEGYANWKREWYFIRIAGPALRTYRSVATIRTARIPMYGMRRVLSCSSAMPELS